MDQGDGLHGERFAQLTATSTLFALASGRPPAAIAVIRISGPAAAQAITALTGRAPAQGRRVALRRLRDPEDGRLLDTALTLFLPGPASPTGEDVAELHLHGGRAVIAAVLKALGRLPGFAPAGPGAFTRRAFDRGVMDLTQVEGLADLIDAETEDQRRSAIERATGMLYRRAEEWRLLLLDLLADIEASLDFADEDDVTDVAPEALMLRLAPIVAAMRRVLAIPVAERYRDGIRVVVVGPTNAGKSSLVNRLAGRDAAIVTPIAGTTRDLIEVPVIREGLPFLLIDTAGERDTEDPIEREGLERARGAAAAADIIIDLGGAARGVGVIPVQSKADLLTPDCAAGLAVSAKSGEGLEALWTLLVGRGRAVIGGTGGLSNQRQWEELNAACVALEQFEGRDMVLAADAARRALVHIGRLTGRVSVEDMLDRLFSRLCIGK